MPNSMPRLFGVVYRISGVNGFYQTTVYAYSVIEAMKKVEEKDFGSYTEKVTEISIREIEQ